MGFVCTWQTTTSCAALDDCAVFVGAITDRDPLRMFSDSGSLCPTFLRDVATRVRVSSVVSVVETVREGILSSKHMVGRV